MQIVKYIKLWEKILVALFLVALGILMLGCSATQEVPAKVSFYGQPCGEFSENLAEVPAEQQRQYVATVVPEEVRQTMHETVKYFESQQEGAGQGYLMVVATIMKQSCEATPDKPMGQLTGEAHLQAYNFIMSSLEEAAGTAL